MWKFTSENDYNNIILHDCVVEKVTLEGNDLVIEFNDNGFWIGEKNNQNPYKKLLRTEKSELRFVDFDIDNIDIHIFKRYNFFRIFHHVSRVDISFEELISNINSGKWRFEFLYEYYAGVETLGAIFDCWINVTNKQKSYDCQIKLGCSKMIYSWNKIDEDATW